jgi:uncharacterized protein
MNDTIDVEIIEAHARHVLRERVSAPAIACVRDALHACALERAKALIESTHLIDHAADSFVGVWGRRVLLDTKLEHGDRIELYRELIADAKTARLKRANEQGYRWQGRTRRAAKQVGS